MLQLSVIVLASALFSFCESAAFLDKINKKCLVSDDGCVRSFYESLIAELGDNGIPEFDIPRGDPLVIKDADVVALGMIKLIVKEGEAKGFKSCKPLDLKVDLANQRHTIDFTCERISIEGSYKIESTPTLLGLLGGINIHGEGNGGIVIEKINLSLDFAFEVKKLDDGELHIQIKPDDTTISFNVKEKATIHADNILVGNQEISSVVVNIFNENWDIITNQFGKVIIDKLMEMFMGQAQVLFTKIAAKDLIADDLSSYVKN